MNTVSPKTKIVVFLILTFTLSGIFQYLIYAGGGIQSEAGFYALPLMWMPGLAGVMCCLIFREGFAKLLLGKPGAKDLWLSYLFPALAAIFVFSFLIFFKISEFEINPRLLEKYGSMESLLFKVFGLGATFYVALSMISALGEELGWRGYLHSSLNEAGIKHSGLLIGAIWGCWHLPLIFWGGYATSDKPLLSASIFMINIVAMSFIMQKTMLKNPSVWSPTLAHATHNVWIQAIYPAFILAGPLDPYFGGESGIFLTLIYVVMAMVAAILTRRQTQR